MNNFNFIKYNNKWWLKKISIEQKKKEFLFISNTHSVNCTTHDVVGNIKTIDRCGVP
jgi:hypothetical protein